MDTTFARVIEDHLELKRRNSGLDTDMPLSRYHVNDPFENHPLFKTEEQARIEDTLDGSRARSERRDGSRLASGSPTSDEESGTRTASGAALATSTGATEASRGNATGAGLVPAPVPSE